MPSAAATPSRSAPATTPSTLGSDAMRNAAGRASSSADGAAHHDAAQPRPFARALRTAFRNSASASDVTAQLLNTATSASAARATISWPFASTIARTASLS